MLHYQLKIEVFKRCLIQSNIDHDVIDEIINFWTNLYSEYNQLYACYEKCQSNNYIKNKIYGCGNYSSTSVEFEKLLEQKQISEDKFNSIVQQISKLEAEKKQLKAAIEEIILIINDFVLEMPTSLVERCDALINKIIEQ